ncbi:copper homeostasis protein cutC homolog [Anneissia japonica]|uniref:copper homeostasis protein cutC homolog n=1 Tax=Anneissia japonica TaxID=1529436 RepID=UPI0014257EF5|nr:copper homeostasis protein cutC homolog [Anneissia japonica]
MEVCVDSVESAIIAERGGANRIELCSGLMEGGITPTQGLLKMVRTECRLPIFVLIRPRGGDFCYSSFELEVMRQDLLLAKDCGANGIVIGFLNRKGEIDVEKCKEFISLSRPLEVTFSRAFDMVADPYKSLEVLIDLGFERVLTSGLDSSVLEGLPVIRKLIEQARGRIIVMPGGGINDRNLRRILEGCGANEYHCSARTSQDSKMLYRNTKAFMGGVLRPPEFVQKIADSDLIRRLVEEHSDILK